MKRTYIPFYLNKAENCTLYYDYEADYFFKSPGTKRGSINSILSGTTGVLVYVLFKDSILNIGTDSPLTVVVISLLISCLVAFIAILGIKIEMKKNEDKLEIVAKPSPRDTLEYINDGGKWLKSSLLLTFYLSLFLFVIIAFLYKQPLNGLLFFSNIILWAVLYSLIWSIRPVKRIKIYKRMKEEVLKSNRELI